MTGVALSGNKIRKLEFVLADAAAKKADTVLTCGGAQSNHCRATLIAAAIMRSFKYAFTAIVPILLVVAWVYGFMWLADLKINPVTATIAAIAPFISTAPRP